MWTIKDGALYQKFLFEDFGAAFEFMKKVSVIAEQMNHHPRWMNEYDIVEIWLQTHESNNQITSKDQALANAIDTLLMVK